MATALQLLNTFSSPVSILKDGDALQTRPRINIIEGSNVTIDVTDDPTNYKTDITITATGGGGSGVGTVTSVDLSGGTTGMSFSGGPITSSGTITMAGTLGVANGGTGKVTFTSGYVKADGTTAFTSVASIPGTDITGNISGNASSLTSVLPISLGGTNATTASDARTSLGLGTVAIENIVPIAKGGTGATTASDARTALDVPTKAGSGATGTWGIDISGNAATVSNGVYTTGSYANPAWITSLAGSKVTGNISGNAANVTGVVAIANGGTGATTATAALNALGGYAASNPAGYTTNTGTVTSVSGNGTVNGITLSGTVTTTGNITLGGTLSGVNLATQVTGSLPAANGGVPTGGAKYARLAKNSTTNYDTGWYGPYVVNVKDYGATGNGSTDDKTAIYAAMAALTNNSTLYFPAGVYMTSGWLSFDPAHGIVASSLSNIAIAGDGMGATTIRVIRSGSNLGGGVVINVPYTCSKFNLLNFTADGNCVARIPGQNGIAFAASYSLFRNVEVVNAGQFSMAIGRYTGDYINDISVIGCVVKDGYADGINFNHVQRGLIVGNIVNEADDDCVALGNCQNVVVANNVIRGRTNVYTEIPVTSITRSGTTATVTYGSNNYFTGGDPVYVNITGADQTQYNGTNIAAYKVGNGYTQLTYTVSGSPATPATGTIKIRTYANGGYTMWGRGIWGTAGANNTIANNIIHNVKLDGVRLENEYYGRPQHYLISQNSIYDCGLLSGGGNFGARLLNCDYVDFINNRVSNQASAAIEVFDWNTVTISGNTITLTNDVFCRAVHAQESASATPSTPFTRLKIVKNNISLTNNGASSGSNECIRINPGAASRWTHSYTTITNNDCFQANGTAGASPYIDVDWCNTGCKIGNNTESRGLVVATGGNNVVAPTTFNNN